MAERVSKRSLVIVISDFLSDQDAVIDGLHHMRYAGHDLIMFQVLDHSEVSFEFDGQVRFEEAETHDRVLTDAQAVRAGYLEALNAFIETYRQACRGVRADFVQVDNRTTFDKALVEFLAQRQARC